MKTSTEDRSFDEPSYLAPEKREPEHSGVEIAALFCEGLTYPLGIEAAHPRLSWHLHASRRGARGAACQVEVASSPEKLAADKPDVWDSQRRSIEGLGHLAYQGRSLASKETVWWRCRIWDEEGNPSAWSQSQSWEMGLLADEDWQGAKWIQPTGQSAASPYFRREFTVESGVRRARAYFCGLGFGELWLNGTKASDGVLDPAQTDYERYAFYRVFDVTAHLVVGGNCVGAILGDGFYHQDKVWGYEPYGWPGLRLALLLDYGDGREEWVISEEDWLSTDNGPIRSSNIYAGEVYDATQEIPDWNTVGSSTEGWKKCLVPGKPLSPVLRAQLMPPERATQLLPAVHKQRTRPGTWVFDFGQNFAGYVRLKVTGARGAEYCLRFAENVDLGGDIDPLSTGTLYTKYVPTDRYFCRGDAVEQWEPRFTCHGFRYVEVTGFSGEPDYDALIGVAVHTDFVQAGSFLCSDPLINELQSMALWTLRSNLHGLPTDCPAREKCGWLGDSHQISAVASYNFDLGNFWRKYFTDILNSCGQAKIKVDNSKPDPRMPSNIAPGLRRCEQAHPDWAAAMILIPWHLFLFEGDRETFTLGYEPMKGMMSYLAESFPDGIVKEGFGDWCPPARKDIPSDCPVPLTSTAFYYQTILCMERFARELHLPDEERHFQELGKKVRYQFNSRFLNLEEGTYGSQTGNVIALALGLPPEPLRQRVADALAFDVGQKSQGHFTMGIHGMRYAFTILSAFGRNDICRQILDTTTFPSFRHLISQGATTFWETFFDLGLHPDLAERSRNHPMHAAFAAWFYQGIGGISPDPLAPGFATILLQPQMTESLEWAETTYVSARGPIESNWRIEADQFFWTVTIPGGSIGKLTFPSRVRKGHLWESDKALTDGEAFRITTSPGGQLEIEIGSGRYEFRAELH